MARSKLDKRKRLKGQEKERVVLQLAERYCEGDKVSRIAEGVGLPRTTALRLIKEAISSGYIVPQNPIFNPPQNADLGNRLRRAFSLKDAVVTTNPGGPKPESIRRVLGIAAAEFLDDIFQRSANRKLLVGLSGGTTVAEVVNRLPAPKEKTPVEVYPLHILERTLDPDYASANLLVASLARKYQSENFQVGIQEVISPGTGAEWRSEREKVKKLRVSGEIQRAWSNLDVAVMSVAPLDSASWSVRALSKVGWTHSELRKLGALAVMNLAFLTRDGSIPEDFFLSIPMETLRRLARDIDRHIILVAGGKSFDRGLDKTEAILVVLRAKLANTIVTDDITATELLKKA